MLLLSGITVSQQWDMPLMFSHQVEYSHIPKWWGMKEQVEVLKWVTGIFWSSVGLGRCQVLCEQGHLGNHCCCFPALWLGDLMTSRSDFCSDLLTAGFLWLNQNLPVDGASKYSGVLSTAVLLWPHVLNGALPGPLVSLLYPTGLYKPYLWFLSGTFSGSDLHSCWSRLSSLNLHSSLITEYWDGCFSHFGARSIGRGQPQHSLLPLLPPVEVQGA